MAFDEALLMTIDHRSPTYRRLSQLPMTHLVRLQQPPMAHFLEHLKGTTPLPEPEHWILSVHRLGEAPQKKEKSNKTHHFPRRSEARQVSLWVWCHPFSQALVAAEKPIASRRSPAASAIWSQSCRVLVSQKTQLRLSIPKELLCMLPLAPLKLWGNHWGARGKSIPCVAEQLKESSRLSRTHSLQHSKQQFLAYGPTETMNTSLFSSQATEWTKDENLDKGKKKCKWTVSEPFSKWTVTLHCV